MRSNSHTNGRRPLNFGSVEELEVYCAERREVGRVRELLGQTRRERSQPETGLQRRRRGEIGDEQVGVVGTSGLERLGDVQRSDEGSRGEGSVEGEEEGTQLGAVRRTGILRHQDARQAENVVLLLEQDEGSPRRLDEKGSCDALTIAAYNAVTPRRGGGVRGAVGGRKGEEESDGGLVDGQVRDKSLC